MAVLARRDHSRQELLLKLRTKGYAPEGIKIVVSHLDEAGLINESRFTESYIYWRRDKGFGPERINLELQARGITEAMIAEHLQIADNAWFTEARKVWQKHFRGKSPSDFKERARQMRFLQHRGFTREQIDFVLSDNAED